VDSEVAYVRDFAPVASFLIPHRRKVHVVMLLLSLLMLPGLAASLAPIDIEAYDMESPELTADKVLNEDFASAEFTVGMMVTIRDPANIGDAHAPHVDADGNAIRRDLPSPHERIAYPGEGAGLEGDGVPVGGVLNLTVLREIDAKVEMVKAEPIAAFFRPMVSELTGSSASGVLSLPDQFRAFMAGQSTLTVSSASPLGADIPPRTNWTDCGALDCLTFDDANLTQAHIDLAANRMVLASPDAFMRWMSNDRGFLPDPASPVVGPYGGTLSTGGDFEGAAWVNGRWSASSTWILVQLSRDDFEANGFTLSWADARTETGGYAYEGVRLLTTPPHHSIEDCQAFVEAGEAPCSAEWALMAMEEKVRITDELTVSIIVADGINVELNREMAESFLLLIAMVFAVLILLWASLRRLSDVAIVGTSLGFSLIWMQGSIGWAIILGDAIGVGLISKSQFSNLLPILVLALGIDDSLHALHRYKEERRAGNSPERAAHITLSKVGRAIMLTTLTTMAAFAANLFSNVPALRSFGIEAALGVLAAFILTGLWAPLLRLEFDLFQAKREKLAEERSGQLHLVPEHWLARTSGFAAWSAPLILIATLAISAIATPVMLGLEGDFKVEDFLDDESDFNQGVIIVNTRFAAEGEPAAIVVEGDMVDPRVYAAIAETRANMQIAGPNDPRSLTKTPSGATELHGIDELINFAFASMAVNRTPFEVGGWDPGALGCEITLIGLPDVNDEDCLRFFYGFLSVYGIPAGGIIPPIPPSIPALYITPDCTIDPAAVHRCTDGTAVEYPKMTMRFGVGQAEKFAIVKRALNELESDLSPFQNLSADNLRVRGDTPTEEYPVTWAIATGQPVTRYVASDMMQGEMQGSLVLGVFFCLITLWWGFRDSREARLERGEIPGIEFGVLDLGHTFAVGALAGGALGLVMGMAYDPLTGTLCGLAVVGLTFVLGYRSLVTALVTTVPILAVVVWLYGMIALAGYGLNLVTVAIAAMSLGVGIDYVIHVVERFREERERGRSVYRSLAVMGGASGLALVGSAVSDITGFAIIAMSPMGFFSVFGLFCATMIALSLIASMLICSAVLGAFGIIEVHEEARAAGGLLPLMRQTEEALGLRHTESVEAEQALPHME